MPSKLKVFRKCFLINISFIKFILKINFNLKTTNVSKNNNINQKKSKTLAIIDFLVCVIGIASFFQPKWTSLFAVFNAFFSWKIF